MQAAEKKAQAIQLQQDIQEVKHVLHEWVVNAPMGATQEDVLKPEFLAHFAFKLTIRDEIRIFAYDGSWMLVTIVVDCGKTWARLVVLSKYDLAAPTDVVASTKYDIDYKGPTDQFCIIRASDRSVIKKGIKSMDKAREELAAVEKRIG